MYNSFTARPGSKRILLTKRDSHPGKIFNLVVRRFLVIFSLVYGRLLQKLCACMHTQRCGKGLKALCEGQRFSILLCQKFNLAGDDCIYSIHTFQWHICNYSSRTCIHVPVLIFDWPECQKKLKCLIRPFAFWRIIIDDKIACVIPVTLQCPFLVTCVIIRPYGDIICP